MKQAPMSRLVVCLFLSAWAWLALSCSGHGGTSDLGESSRPLNQAPKISDFAVSSAAPSS